MIHRIAISPLAQSDCAEFIAAAAASKHLHAAWVHPPLSASAFNARLQRMQPPDNFAFAIRLRTGALVGYADVTNVVRGAFMSAYLSYYAFQGHERRGLMTEAIGKVVRFAFGKLRLHRLEANIQPGNIASIALVRACGFSREGYSPRYLRIGGRWRDHERWALLAR
jgi:ribosomal-protein-alanine N-acetyltransferase